MSLRTSTALSAVGSVNLHCVASVNRRESSQHPLFAPRVWWSDWVWQILCDTVDNLPGPAPQEREQRAKGTMNHLRSCFKAVLVIQTAFSLGAEF